MAGLKVAVQKAKVGDKIGQILAITSYKAVGNEFNPDGTVKHSLEEDLEAFAAALAEKASSTAVSEEIQQACKELQNKLLGKANDDTTIDEAYDTLKEIADWIGTHGEAASTLINDVTKLKTDLENLAQKIEDSTGTNVEASAINGNIKVDGQEVEVYRNPAQNIFVASTAAQATAAEGKMKEGDILFQIVPGEVELKDASNEIKTANHFIGDFATLLSDGTITQKTDGFSEMTLAGGTPAKSNIPSYKIGTQCTGSVATGDIFYADGYSYGGGMRGTANLATGSLSGGSSTLNYPTVTLPTGYYRIKHADEYTGTDNIFNIIRAAFDSSGNVTDITKTAFNDNNECVEYLGESYLVTEQ